MKRTFTTLLTTNRALKFKGPQSVRLFYMHSNMPLSGFKYF